MVAVMGSVDEQKHDVQPPPTGRSIGSLGTDGGLDVGRNA